MWTLRKDTKGQTLLEVKSNLKVCVFFSAWVFVAIFSRTKKSIYFAVNSSSFLKVSKSSFYKCLLLLGIILYDDRQSTGFCSEKTLSVNLTFLCTMYLSLKLLNFIICRLAIKYLLGKVIMRLEKDNIGEGIIM